MNELIEKYHNLVVELIPKIIEAGLYDIDNTEYMILCTQKKIYLQIIEELESLEHSKKLY